MLHLRNLATFATMALRGPRMISTTSTLRSAESLAKLKKLQSDFQREDGVPIFLKAGVRDRFLYTLTLILCVVGVTNVLIVLYDQAKPASWKTGGPAC